ncbi:uncharacterized protein LOC134280136 [Saccostrea cucullata]|uniref:uncharacterized protein LOC134280136 n=1 Tax=Saccostrea cuccullata TaxID=36930 RepID=UPI002ED6B645
MRVFILYALSILFLLQLSFGERLANFELEKSEILKPLLKDLDAAKIKPHTHAISKRGLGSVFFLGVTTTIRLGSLAVNVAGAVTKGCAFFPRMCDNIKSMEKLEEDIKKEKKEFREMFIDHNKDFVDFRTAYTNNGFINYYINETVKKISTIREMQEDINAKLEAYFPTSVELTDIANKSDFNTYLSTLSMQRLEYSLKDIQTMLQKQQEMQIIGIVAQLLIESAINSFSRSFQKAYQQVTEDLFSGSQIQATLGEFEQTSESAVKLKLKAVPKALKQMAKNARDSFLKRKTALAKKLKQARTMTAQKMKSFKKAFTKEAWKDIGGNMKENFKNSMKNMKLKAKIAQGKFKAKLDKVKQFKISKLNIGLSVVGVIADVVSIGLNVDAWKKKDEEIADAKTKMENHLVDLKENKNNLTNVIVQLGEEWKKVIATFKESSETFESVMKNLSKYNDFVDVVGVPRLALNESKSLLSVNYQGINRDNILRFQSSVLAFLNANNDNLTAISEALRARSILYDYVTENTNKSKGVLQMTDFLHSLYRLDASPEVRRYGSQLRKKDVVCTVAILRADKNFYDYYPLEPFVPRCEVNDTFYTAMDKEATKQRNMRIMDEVIENEFKKESVIGLSEMMSAIRNAYQFQSEQSLRTFATSITEKDVLCRIASKYTTITHYDFIQLSFFRLNCPDISDEDMRKIKEKASKNKMLQENMKSIMDTCTKWKFCPCIANIAATIGANEDDIKAAIKQMLPEKKTYCGTTGCECIDL